MLFLLTKLQFTPLLGVNSETGLYLSRCACRRCMSLGEMGSGIPAWLRVTLSTCHRQRARTSLRAPTPFLIFLFSLIDSRKPNEAAKSVTSKLSAECTIVFPPKIAIRRPPARTPSSPISRRHLRGADASLSLKASPGVINVPSCLP